MPTPYQEQARDGRVKQSPLVEHGHWLELKNKALQLHGTSTGCMYVKGAPINLSTCRSITPFRPRLDGRLR